MKELGNILQEKRKEKQLSIDQVASDLRIRNSYITRIEEGGCNLDNVYILGYIKNYASYLKIDIADYLRKLDNRETSQISQVKNKKPSIDSSSPPVNLVLVSVFLIIISAALLIILNNYKFNKQVASPSNTPIIEQKVKDISKPEMEILNSFSTVITDVNKYNKIVVTAKTPVEISVFDNDNELIIRKKLNSGESYQFKENTYKKLKFITNVPKGIEFNIE